MTAALVPVAGDRAAGYLAATMARAQNYARNSSAASTLRAYAADLRDFERYCASIAAPAFPASAETLVLYLTDLADRAKIATIRRRLVAINRAHRERGLPSPTAHEVVRAVVTGIANVNGSAPRRKTALTDDLVRGALLETAPGIRGARDRAIMLLGFAAALRRSELAVLDVSDLAFAPQGLVVRLRRSKTDQAGKAATSRCHRSRSSPCAPCVPCASGSTSPGSPRGLCSARSRAAAPCGRTRSVAPTSPVRAIFKAA